MFNNNQNSNRGGYQTPEIQVVTLENEGVLCQSTVESGAKISDWSYDEETI